MKKKNNTNIESPEGIIGAICCSCAACSFTLVLQNDRAVANIDTAGRPVASSPGAEWHHVLIRAPVTGVGHSEQILVSLKGFFGRLDSVKDQVIVDDFLMANRQR